MIDYSMGWQASLSRLLAGTAGIRGDMAESASGT